MTENTMAGTLRAAVLGTALLAGTVGAGPVFAATVVNSNYGSVYMNAFSAAYTVDDNSPQSSGVDIHADTDTDNDIFILAPHALSAGVSVRSISSQASSSLAAEVSADWTSADHGTVALNTISSLSVSNPGPHTDSFSGYVLNPADQLDPHHLSDIFQGSINDLWFYNFTPTVDAVLSLSAQVGLNIISVNDDYSIEQFRFYLNDDFVGSTSSTFNKSIDLLAGHDYTIRLQPVVYSYIGTSNFDSLTISTLNLTFDIAAASGSTDPGDGGTGGGGTGGGGMGGVPEPASWAMMIAGFGLVGLALRRRATRPNLVMA